ncbi:MAG TPA: NUDIX domain-containing protein [Candidatus Paceibacterota bacterium]|nr:NUDIX domain-containing protein [Candidatus Paceibacterota bacterium]HPT17818.1 NUDIX domain-containing protein [Candidatus Paceibacterota bacterium]
MKKELIIEVDEKNNVIGLRPREDFHREKHIHRSCHLMLFNSKNEVAIMKRSPNKRWYPNLYTFSVSGTVDNETTAMCIERETKEEVGLDIKPKELFTFYHSDTQDSAFATLYLAISDNKITPEEKEISLVKWVKLDWLKKDTKNNPEKYSYPLLEGLKVYWERYGTKLENVFTEVLPM